MSKPDWLTDNYTALPNLVIKTPLVSGNELKIYAFILSRMEPRELSYAEIKRATGITSYSTISISIKNLKEVGLINYSPGYFNCDGEKKRNTYEVLPLTDLTVLSPKNGSIHKMDQSTKRTVVATKNESISLQKLETNKTIRKDKTSAFNFDDLYASYPRKQGKKAGLDYCKKHIRTKEQYEALKNAIKNYSQETKDNKTETRFIKYFSSFVRNGWHDYTDENFQLINQKNLPSPQTSWGDDFADSLTNKKGAM